MEQEHVQVLTKFSSAIAMATRDPPPRPTRAAAAGPQVIRKPPRFEPNPALKSREPAPRLARASSRRRADKDNFKAAQKFSPAGS